MTCRKFYFLEKDHSYSEIEKYCLSQGYEVTCNGESSEAKDKGNLVDEEVVFIINKFIKVCAPSTDMPNISSISMDYSLGEVSLSERKIYDELLQSRTPERKKSYDAVLNEYLESRAILEDCYNSLRFEFSASEDEVEKAGGALTTVKPLPQSTTKQRNSYEYLKSYDEVSFSDVVNLSKNIYLNNKAIEKGDPYSEILRMRTHFFKELGDSILRGLNSSRTMDEYSLDRFMGSSFVSHELGSVLIGLHSIREVYKDTIHCFEGDFVGNRWRTIYGTALGDDIRSIVDGFKMFQCEQSSAISHLDKILAFMLGEDGEGKIRVSDLSEKFGFALDISKIGDRYFPN